MESEPGISTDGCQVPRTHGATKRVRRATATPPDAADGAVDPVFLKPIGGRRAANLVGIFLCCSLARDHAAGPLS
jgi:hypothetical protein